MIAAQFGSLNHALGCISNREPAFPGPIPNRTCGGYARIDQNDPQRTCGAASVAPRVEPAFNILFVGHPTPANLSERLARTGHSGDRALPTVTITCRGPVEFHFAAAAKRWRLVHLHLARPSRFVVT